MKGARRRTSEPRPAETPRKSCQAQGQKDKVGRGASPAEVPPRSSEAQGHKGKAGIKGNKVRPSAANEQRSSRRGTRTERTQSSKLENEIRGDDVDVRVALPEDVEVDAGDAEELLIDNVEILNDDVDVEDVVVEDVLGEIELETLR